MRSFLRIFKKATTRARYSTTTAKKELDFAKQKQFAVVADMKKRHAHARSAKNTKAGEFIRLKKHREQKGADAIRPYIEKYNSLN